MKKVKRMFAGALTGQGVPLPRTGGLSRMGAGPAAQPQTGMPQLPTAKLAQMGQLLQERAKLGQTGQALQGARGSNLSQGLASIAKAPPPSAAMGITGGLGRAGATPPAGVNPLAGKTMPNQGRMAKGGKVVSASKRADGCAIRGKTRGKMV